MYNLTLDEVIGNYNFGKDLYLEYLYKMNYISKKDYEYLKNNTFIIGGEQKSFGDFWKRIFDSFGPNKQEEGFINFRAIVATRAMPKETDPNQNEKKEG